MTSRKDTIIGNTFIATNTTGNAIQTSNYARIHASQATFSTYDLYLPTSSGLSGQFLTTSGAGGILTWTTQATQATPNLFQVLQVGNDASFQNIRNVNQLGFGNATIFHTDLTGSLIVGGHSNLMTDGIDSIILGGLTNENWGNRAVILGGYNHLMNDTGAYSANNSAIVGGHDNNMNANDSVILGGNNNNNGSSAINSVILGGQLNSNTKPYSGMIGGDTNTNTGDNSVILAGAANSNSGLYSVISGYTNTNTGDESTIVGGVNHVNSGLDSAIVGGANNRNTGLRSIVLGGLSNKNTGSGTNNAILGGESNSNVDGLDIAIIAGKNNTINGSSYSAIFGGQNNKIDTASVGYIFGSNNTLGSGTPSVNLIFGENNSNSGGTDVFIAGENILHNTGSKNVLLGTNISLASGDNNFIWNGLTETLQVNSNGNMIMQDTSGLFRTTGTMTIKASGSLFLISNATNSIYLNSSGNIYMNSGSTNSSYVVNANNVYLKNGGVGLRNTTGNQITFRVSDSTFTNYTLTFPSSSGSSAQFLQTDGTGNLSWNYPDAVELITTSNSTISADINKSIIFSTNATASGRALWATKIGGNTTSISLDFTPSGNIVVIGYGVGNISLFNSNDSLNSSLTFTSNAINNLWVVKYDTNGNVSWKTKLEGNQAGNLFDNDVKSDTNGNILITSSYITNMTIYNSNLVVAKTITGTGSNSSALVKYDTNGNFIWSSRLIGGGSIIPSGLDIDKTDNSIAITGRYSANSTLFNSNDSVGKTLTIGGANPDMFIAQYSTNGTVNWVSFIKQTSGTPQTYKLSIDSTSRNIVMTGFYTTALTLFSQNGATGGTLSTPTAQNQFLTSYSTNGTFQWVNRVNTNTAISSCYPISISPGSGDINIGQSGSPTSTTLFNSNGSAFVNFVGGSQFLMVQYNSSGYVNWYNIFGNTNFTAFNINNNDINGDIDIVGSYNANTTIYNADGSISGTLPASTTDAYHLKYDRYGHLIAYSRMTGSGPDAAYGSAIDSRNGDVVICGSASSGASIYDNQGITLFKSLTLGSFVAINFIVKYQGEQVKYLGTPQVDGQSKAIAFDDKNFVRTILRSNASIADSGSFLGYQYYALNVDSSNSFDLLYDATNTKWLNKAPALKPLTLYTNTIQPLSSTNALSLGLSSLLGGTTRLYGLPAAQVSQTSSQSLTGATDTSISYQVVIFDTHGFFNSSNNTRLTVPSGLGGYYFLTGCFRAAGNTSYQVSIRRNGIFYINGEVQLGSGYQQSVTCIMYGNPGDYFEVQAYAGVGTTTNISTSTVLVTWFQCIRISG